MNGEKILLDTNIALYLLGGDATLATILNQKEVFLSIISEMELLAYPTISDVEIQSVKSFIADANILELTQPIKEIAISIKRQYKLKLPDAIIAASAIQANLPLISADTIFRRIPQLHFLEYKL